MIAARVSSGFNTERLPSDWTKNIFDDYDWQSAPGVTFAKGGWGTRPGVPLIYSRGTDTFVPEIGLMGLRGKFIVKDVAKINKLSLNITYRGGVVVYLNGKEIARNSLPAGEIKYNTVELIIIVK